jgi:hypothetical protein
LATVRGQTAPRGRQAYSSQRQGIDAKLPRSEGPSRRGNGKMHPPRCCYQLTADPTEIRVLTARGRSHDGIRPGPPGSAVVRCIVPLPALPSSDGKKLGNTWFAFDADRPLAFFAGNVPPQWTSVRKTSEGMITSDLPSFLTTDPNDVVAQANPDAMPVILTRPDEIETWITAPWKKRGSCSAHYFPVCCPSRQWNRRKTRQSRSWNTILIAKARRAKTPVGPPCADLSTPDTRLNLASLLYEASTFCWRAQLRNVGPNGPG